MNSNDPRLTHVSISAEFCNMALTEIHYLSENMSSDEIKLLNGHPFSFYRVTLQYCFNSEYNKLLEPDLDKDRNKPHKHIASIIKLNSILNKSEKEAFNSIYLENKKIINEICESEFYKHQRKLRNKKFSHADNDEINNPLKVKGPTDDEIQIGFSHLEMIYRVINNCTNYLGFDVKSQIPHYDDRTRKFIKYHSVYKKYFHDNFQKAISQGYNLR